MEPSRLGKALSDTITRRLIIGVLILLMMLPVLTYSAEDYSSEYGLRKIFWFGRSNCEKSTIKLPTFLCQDKGNWMEEEGWKEMLRQYVKGSRAVETD